MTSRAIMGCRTKPVEHGEVAGPKLSPDAVAALRAIAEVPAAAQFETESMILPPNTFAVHKLEFVQSGVHFAGTLGPLPRPPAHGCGDNWSMTVRQHANGWSIEDTRITMC